VSLAALAVDGGGYLVESGPLIQYLSTERDLVALESTQPTRGLLALAAPAFDGEAALLAGAGSERKGGQGGTAGGRSAFRGARSACADFQSLRFDPLPASGTEMREVAAAWRRGKTSGGDPAVQLRGAYASEAAFKQQAPGKRVLHLATHGFFLGDRCASALEAAGPGATRPPLAAENPLLLALAGANRRATVAPDQEDGILTAEEVAALDLQGVEWAVLSACDTGAGEVRKGEGVFGLRRAFQLAGARTVIMSLWPVEDEATREWMKALYRGRFLSGLSSAEAVREATLTLLRERRAAHQATHPFHWGGFIAVGEWR
jgi:CHAT domain-containing protein